MARFTRAYSNLMVRFDEVQTLLRLARAAQALPPLPVNLAQIDTLCRSGVVLLSGHIEGYVEELGTIALDRLVQKSVPKSRLNRRFKYYLSRDLIINLKATQHPERLAAHIEQLFTRDGYIWDGSPTFSQPLPTSVFIGDFSNPSHGKICDFLKRFGYDGFNTDISRLLASSAAACINMVNQVIEQRNRIAHGDTVTIGTATELAGMLGLAKEYCRAADSAIGNWFSTQNCPIR